MKEHPILFSGPLVRAILDGRKTQTRRVLKDAPPRTTQWLNGLERDAYRWWPANGSDYTGDSVLCPYGAPGDRLWVRETWRYADWTEDGQPWIQYAADGARILCERVTPEWAERVGDHWADLSSAENVAVDGLAADRKWRPSIFLPRWASRLTLAVTAVRVERLQEISDDDAKAEGVEPFTPPHGCISPDQRVPGPGFDGVRLGDQPHRLPFAHLWDDINGDRAAWAGNPWVWVIEFKRIGGVS